MTSYDKVIVIPDAHHPFQDEKSMNTMLVFVKEQRPDKIVIIGDWVDLYRVSKFDKNPERNASLQHELDVAHKALKKLQKAAPQAKIVYCEGNHEIRLEKFLWKNSELFGLDCLTIPELLGLEELGIDYVKEWVWKNTFVFTHGKRASKYASGIELDNNCMSGISGHTHREQHFSKTGMNGCISWYNIGHLCDPAQAEYVRFPNWQQAIGLVWLSRSNKDYSALVIPIIKHRIIYAGKQYDYRSGVTML